MSIAWEVVSIVVAILVGTGFSMLGLTPPEFAWARRLFWISATVLSVMTVLWLFFTGAGNEQRWFVVFGVGLYSAVALPLGLFFVAKRERLQTDIPQSTFQSASKVLATASSNFDAADYFRRAYYSTLQEEAEANVRRAAQENQPNDREGFYAKLIGVGLTAYIYDTIWWAIFRSQLLFLIELNRKNGLLPLSDAKVFYDQAAGDFPTEYKSIPFDDWLSYMKNQILIIRHPSDMAEITMRGKDFLKYLVHCGRDADQRRL